MNAGYYANAARKAARKDKTADTGTALNTVPAVENTEEKQSRLLDKMNSLTRSMNTLKTAQGRGIDVSAALAERRAELDEAQEEYSRIARSGTSKTEDTVRPLSYSNGGNRSAARDIMREKSEPFFSLDKESGGRADYSKHRLPTATDGKGSLSQRALNTVGGSAANFLSQYAGNPLRLLARLSEGPEDVLYAVTKDERFNQDNPKTHPRGRDSVALWEADTFRQAAEDASDSAGYLGKQVIGAAGAAGNMMSAYVIGKGLTGAMNIAGRAGRLESIANSSKLLSSPLSRAGAGAAARILRDIAANPGNAGISFGSAVNSYSDAMANGAGFGQAVKNGLAKGLTEYFSNKLFSGTPLEDSGEQAGYVTRLIEHVADRLGKSEALRAFNQSTGGGLLAMLYDRAGEGLEEVVTGIADPLIDRLTYDKDADLATADRLADEFVGGVLLSLIMSGGEAVISRAGGAGAQRDIADYLVRHGLDRSTAEQFAPKLVRAIRKAQGEARSSTEKPRYLPAPGITEAEKARLNEQRKNTPEAPRYLPAPGMTEEEAARLRALRGEQSAAATETTTGQLRNRDKLFEDENGQNAAENEQNQKTAENIPGESTAVNDDPAQHTSAEQQLIEEYKAGTDQEIIDFVERVRSLKNQDYKNAVRYFIETKTTGAAEKAAELTGTNTEGFKTVINGSSVQHIDKRHGVNGKADHSMADINDFARIGFVLDHFTDARIIPAKSIDPETAKVAHAWMNSDNTPAPLVQYSMPVNGTYYVIEAVPSSKARVMAVISAYIGGKEKKGSCLNQVL